MGEVAGSLACGLENASLAGGVGCVWSLVDLAHLIIPPPLYINHVRVVSITTCQLTNCQLDWCEQGCDAECIWRWGNVTG